ncbi:MAG: TrkH family potassium uptake protein [Clostridia bacterium]|nr:TrkH family potassium uptake protein [Clostridia bacterium]
MNYKMIFYTVGQVLIIEAALLLFPTIVALIYAELFVAFSLAITAVIAFAIGFSSRMIFKTENRVLYAKEGLIIVSLAWICVSLLGSLPFVISGEIPFFVDALFETVSGFTTTGATILIDVEKMSKGLLLWRSFTHWIGGMGVLVFVMAIVSKTPDRTMNILKAEMPGPIVDKLVPKTRDTAKILYLIYIGLTALLIVLLLVGGMPFFDSVVHALGTAGTGGFGIKNDSIAGYSPYLQWVIAVFMFLFGVNFNLYYLILIRKFKNAFSSRELWCYVVIFFSSVVLVSLNIYPLYENISEVIRISCFQVSSIITTTGYSVCDFTSWSAPLAKTVLVLLMFTGACAGSTAGGLKISRVIILFKKIGNELRKVLHPRTATIVTFEGKRVDESTLNGVGTYFAVYIFSFIAILLLLSFEKTFSFEANFTAAASCFNNIGPVFDNALGNGSFANYYVFSKIILSFAMLLGRLEIYPLLLTVAPTTWLKK